MRTASARGCSDCEWHSAGGGRGGRFLARKMKVLRLRDVTPEQLLCVQKNRVTLTLASALPSLAMAISGTSRCGSSVQSFGMEGGRLKVVKRE